MPKRGKKDVKTSGRRDSSASSSDSIASKRSKSDAMSPDHSVEYMSDESESNSSGSATSVREGIPNEFIEVKRRKNRSPTLPSVPPARTPAAPAAPQPGRKSAPAPVPVGKLPPIVVRSIPVSTLRPELQSCGILPVFRLSSVGTSIIVHSRTEQQGVLKYLQQKNAQFFTHDAKDQRPFKAVLRGLPAMELDDIVGELRNQHHLDVLEAFEIKRRAEGIQSRLYLVHFRRGTCSLKKLEMVRSILQVIVRWEAYRGGKKGPTQCHRCQEFGHGTRHCRIHPRCAICAEQHLTENCPSIGQPSPAKCSNCGAAHRGDDPTCPKRAKYLETRRLAENRKQKQQQPQQPPQTVRTPPEPVYPAPPATVPAGRSAAPPPPHTVPAPPTATPPPAKTVPAPRQKNNLAQRLENARNSPDVPASPSAHEPDLFSMEELFGIFTSALSKLRLCRCRADQLAVIGELLTLHG